MYKRFHHVVTIEGSWAEYLGTVLRGGDFESEPSGLIKLPALGVIRNFEGPLALLSRGEPTAISFDGLIHLDRLGLGIYREAGEICEAEIERLKAEEREWQVDYQGEIRLVRTAQGPAKDAKGFRRAPLWACILARPAGPGPEPPPTWWEAIIQLAEEEPSVVTPEDARQAVRWHLRTIAKQRGWPTPPPQVLDRLAAETVRRTLAESPKFQDAALAERVREIGERQRRNDLCRCGSGRKYKHCCIRNN